MVTVPDIVLTWVIQKILDYVLAKVISRGKKSKVSGFEVLSILPKYYITFALWGLSLFKEDAELVRNAYFQEATSSFLQFHKKMHRYHYLTKHSMDKCPICKIIVEEKSFLLELVPDRELYPPFSFEKNSV
jgi:hypothetical protein